MTCDKRPYVTQAVPDREVNYVKRNKSRGRESGFAVPTGHAYSRAVSGELSPEIPPGAGDAPDARGPGRRGGMLSEVCPRPGREGQAAVPRGRGMGAQGRQRVAVFLRQHLRGDGTEPAVSPPRDGALETGPARRPAEGQGLRPGPTEGA